MDIVALHERVKRLEDEGKHDEAIELLEKLTEIEPENELNIVKIALNCLETNEDEKFKKYALKYLEEIPEKDRRPGKNTDWFLYHTLGLKMCEDGKFEESLEYFHNAISKESKAETIAFLGQAHKELGNEKQAISYWRTAAKMGYGQAIMALNSRGIDI